MEKLEDILNRALWRVEDLRKDLAAEIVVQQEEGHYEEEENRGRGDEGRNVDGYRRVYVVDTPKIAYPNTQARTRLQQFYDSCEWYSARYLAGKALEQDVLKELPHWLDVLRQELLSTTNEEGDDGPDIPDIKRREHAIHDIAKLYGILKSPNIRQMLRDAYRLNSLRLVRGEAGRALGYSEFRIGFHEFVLKLCR